MRQDQDVWRRRSITFVTAMALLASLLLHLHLYFGIHLLKEFWAAPQRPASPGSDPIEFELQASASPELSEPEEVVDPPAPEVLPPPRRPPAPAPAAPASAAERAVVVPLPAPAQPPPPPPPTEQRRVSVNQRSSDPNVEPPDEASFLADENNRVREETLARVRSNTRDDPEPQAAGDEPSEAEDEAGDEERVRESEDREGNPERTPTRREEESDAPTREASRSPTPQEAGGRSAGGGVEARGGQHAPATREVVVRDGNGSYVIRVPIHPPGEGGGERGGRRRAGRGEGLRGEGLASGRAGRGRERGRGGRGGLPDGLGLSWTQFTSIYGEDELRRAREARLESRRSRAGERRSARWRRFRAALEHPDVRVRPGNQTALNTRADPFASFIASMHRRIHIRYSDSFIPSMPEPVRAAFQANQNVHTTLELGINAEGRVAHIGVVGTSGEILLDLGAYEAVMAAQPFEPPNEAIRSPDGLAYVHWSFYANHRRCGTFNARPFILAGGRPNAGVQHP